MVARHLFARQLRDRLLLAEDFVPERVLAERGLVQEVGDVVLEAAPGGRSSRW